MTTQQTIIQTIAPILKQAGFRKFASHWIYTYSEMIVVLNLQKSRWGNMFYINLGCYLTALGKNKQPRVYQCQIRTSIQAISATTKDRDRITSALDFEQIQLVREQLSIASILSKTRRNQVTKTANNVQIIATAVQNVAIPWLLSCKNTAAVKHQIKKYQVSDIQIDAKHYLYPATIVE